MGLQLRYGAIAGTLSLCSMWQYGFVLSYVNTAEVAFRRFLNDSADSQLTESHYGWLWSGLLNVYFVGFLIGSVVVPWLAERWGRRAALGLGSTLNVLATLVSVAAIPLRQPLLLGLGRLVVGVGSGVVVNAATLFVQETAALEVRGLASTFLSVSVPLAAALAMLAGMPAVLGWSLELLIGSAVVPELVQLALLCALPETPKYLYAVKGDRDASAHAIRFYQGESADVDDAFRQIREESDESGKADTISLRQLWKTPHLRLATLIGSSVFLALQFSGVVGIFYFSASFFSGLGFSPLAAQLGSVALMALNAVATAASMALVERLGRRTLLLWNEVGIIVSLCVYVLCAELYVRWALRWLGWVSLASIFVYIVFLSLGPGSVCWYITAELVPQEARSLALGVAQFVNNVASLVLGFVLLPAFQVMGSFSFIPFFIIPSILTTLFLFKHMPETKNKEISVIIRMLQVSGAKVSVTENIGMSNSAFSEQLD